MFIVTWMFDKLGYMPKIDIEVGKVNVDLKSPEFGAWPFPAETKKKPVARKTATKKPTAKKKPAVVAKTARTLKK